MGILDIIFPKSCLNCKKPGKYICKNCLKKVSYSKDLNNIISIWKYEGVVKRAILALKYKFASQVGEELAIYLASELKNMNLPFKDKVILLPVPLHTQRQNWRGFNQASQIGKIVAKKMIWNFEPSLVIKTKPSQPQVELPRNQRLRNLSGKFAVNRALREKIDSNCTFLIFDDVATTGSTVKEITKVLKQNGVKKVWGLTIAG